MLQLFLLSRALPSAHSWRMHPCFSDATTAPLTMARPRSRAAPLERAGSCWPCRTHKHTQTPWDKCWHKGTHAFP